MAGDFARSFKGRPNLDSCGLILDLAKEESGFRTRLEFGAFGMTTLPFAAAFVAKLVGGAGGFCGFHFDEFAGADIVEESVDGN